MPKTEKVKTICVRCESVFLGGPSANYCPKCIKSIQSESAKRRNLSQLGHKARAARKEASNAQD